MSDQEVHLQGIPAPWEAYATREEKQRLTVLEARHERKKRIIDDEILAERRLIMRRAIKRMRRSEGKT